MTWLLISSIAFTVPTVPYGPMPTQYIAVSTAEACNAFAAQVRRDHPGAVTSCSISPPVRP